MYTTLPARPQARQPAHQLRAPAARRGGGRGWRAGQGPEVVEGLREGGAEAEGRLVRLQRLGEVAEVLVDNAEIVVRLRAPRVDLQRELVAHRGLGELVALAVGTSIYASGSIQNLYI